MKRILTISLTVCLLLLLVLSMCSFAKQAPDDSVVYDETNRLSTANIDSINAAAKSAKQILGEVDLLFVITTDFDTTAQAVLSEHGYSSSANDVLGLVVFYSPTKGIEYEIYTYGSMSKNISKSEMDNIMDAIYDDIKAGRLASGARTCFAMTAEAGVVTPKDRNKSILYTVLAAVGAGLVAALCGVLIVVTSYRRKNRSASYPLNEYTRLYLSHEKDIFLGSAVTKIPISTGSGSGGHSSGGGGGRSSGRR